ncbi:unnamed protein product [Rotaria magnacalcarata]|uniref:Uncharacterized protein n=1 Tax=Rotaria magnacalcarata TaxID=392030 RepID=A0A8S2LLG8_9BILA|nr:unnamed protein product [Rotaria magnacalcarata]
MSEFPLIYSSNLTSDLKNVSVVLNELLKSYDPFHRPTYGGKPDQVIVDIYVRSMGAVSELDMEYSFDCFFRQRWTDTRLVFNTTEVMNYKSLPVSIKMFAKIWKPDTYFYNGRRSYLHSVPNINRFFRIATNGAILYSQRLTIRASCAMNLRLLPLDTQHCTLLIGSYAYDNEETIYEWNTKSPVDIQSDLIMNQFSLVNASVGTQYLIRDNRVTTVLTLIFVIMEGKKDLPKVSYLTALDCFIAVCFIFVFSTLFEFALVHYYTKARTGDLNENMRELEDYIIRNDDPDSNDHHATNNDVHLVYRSSVRRKSSAKKLTSRKSFSKCCQSIYCKPAYSEFQGQALKNIFYSNSVSQIDIIARVLYPLTFFIFNLIYWTYYLCASQRQSKREME